MRETEGEGYREGEGDGKERRLNLFSRRRFVFRDKRALMSAAVARRKKSTILSLLCGVTQRKKGKKWADEEFEGEVKKEGRRMEEKGDVKSKSAGERPGRPECRAWG